MMCTNNVNTPPSPQDLGYGEQTDAIPSTVDLRYGEETDAIPSTVDLGYGEETSKEAVPADAAPIRPNKRVSKRNSFSIYGNLDVGDVSDWSDSDSEYSETDSDWDEEEDQVHGSLYHSGSFQSLRLSQYGEANPTMPTRVDLLYREDSTTELPSRISLRFSQCSSSGASIGSFGSGASCSTTRTGRLDVSIGTSSLALRRGTNTSQGSFRRPTLSHSICSAPGRRITMDTTTSAPERRVLRRITMDTSPREQQATRRRQTMDHHRNDTRPVVRRITRNTSSRPVRRTTMDNHAIPAHFPPPIRRVARNPSLRPGRRTTMDHRRDRTPKEDPAPQRPSLNRSTRVSGSINSCGSGLQLATMRRVTMDTTKNLRPNRSHSPGRTARRLPQRTFSGRAA